RPATDNTRCSAHSGKTPSDQATAHGSPGCRNLRPASHQNHSDPAFLTKTSVVGFHLVLKCFPFFSWTAIFHQEMRAVLIRRFGTRAGPVVMRDDVLNGDPVALHQYRCELGGTIDGSRNVAAPLFAHLNPDR